jgi:hypothetical protein
LIIEELETENVSSASIGQCVILERDEADKEGDNKISHAYIKLIPTQLLAKSRRVGHVAIEQLRGLRLVVRVLA